MHTICKVMRTQMPYLHEVVSVGELVSFVVLGGVDEGWMVLELELLGIASYLRE